jgi:signal transduction histidine kinase
MVEKEKLTKSEIPWLLKSGLRFFGILFLTLFIPLIILAFSLIAKIGHELKYNSIKENSASARLIAQAISEHFTGLISYIENYANRPTLINALEDKNSESIIAFLNALKESKKEFSSVAILDPSGKLLYQSTPASKGENFDYSKEEWFQIGVITKRGIISPIYLEQNHLKFVTIIAPIFDKDEKIIGYLKTNYGIENLISTVQWLKPGIKSTLYLIDSNNTSISSNGIRNLLDQDKNALPFLSGEQSKTVEKPDPFTKVPSILSYYRVGHTSWLVLLSQPLESVFSFLKDLYLPIFGMILVSLFVMFALSAILFNLLRRYQFQREKIQADLLKKNEEITNYQIDLNQLKSFAFITSHDLQEPIHHLHRLGEKLQTKAKDQLDAESKDYIEQILQSTQTMGHLADQLRDFAKSDSEENIFENVDLNEVVKKVLAEYSEEIEKTAAIIEVGKLPTVRADRNQIEVVIRNIIDNSLKFRQKDIVPHIKISSLQLSRGFVEILFTDNGIGFEEQYAEEVFRPFHQLQRIEKYPGSGLGLTISKKIILRHGGIIIARSVPNKGTTIIIMLPV